MKSLQDAIVRIIKPPGFLGLLGSTVALGIAYAFVAPYLSLWATQEIGLSPQQFGAFITASAAAAMVVGTAVARLSDLRFDRRPLLLLGAAAGVCGYIGYAMLESPLILAGLAVSLVALSTTCFPLLFAHVRDRFNGSDASMPNASLLMSLVRACFSVAWTAGPVVGAAIVVYYGYRELFLGAAFLYAVFAFGVWRCVPRKPPKPHPRRDVSLRHVLSQGRILGAFLAFVAIFAAHAINMINLPLLLTKTLGGSPRDVGVAFGVGAFVEIPLMIGFGHLAGRGHQRHLILWGAFATALYFALLRIAAAPWHVWVIQTLSGVSFAVLTNVAILYFQDLIPGQTGLGTALFANAGSAGNLAGFLGFGSLIAPLGNQGIYTLCAGLAAVAMISLMWIRPSPPVSERG